MKIHNRLIILIICIVSSGCATTLDYDPAVLRFDTPETTGKFLAGNVSVSSAVTPNRVLGSINSSIPSDVNPRRYSDSSEEYTQNEFTMGNRLDLGILKDVDVYYRKLFDTPYIFGSKLQLVGDSQNKKTPGFKVAISAEYGIKTQSHEDGIPESSTREMYSYDIGVNLGFRLNKHIIVYNNNFYNYHHVQGTLDRGTPVFEKKGASKSIGSLFGIRISKAPSGQFVGIEYGFSHIKWPINDKNKSHEITRHHSYGATVGYAW